jgi:DNA modification methylase
MPETLHRLHAGDSADLSFIHNGSIGLVVTSPPYPMIEMWDEMFCRRDRRIGRALADSDGNGAFEMMHESLDKVWAEVRRVLIEGGIACINVGDATRKLGDRFRLFSNHARVIRAFYSLGFDVLPPILWRKQTNAPNKFMGSGMLPAGAYVTLEHEYILILRKGGKREFDAESEKQDRRESAYFWEERNRWFSDLWDLKGIRQALGNPALRQRSAAFPFELAYRLINMYSVRNDTVLDPFLGTGTTTLAAIAAERNSVGVELEASLLRALLLEIGSLAGELNGYIRDRLIGHREFIESRGKSGGPPRHVNRFHGFPVVTSQEKDLKLDIIRSIQRADADTVRVAYGNAPEKPEDIIVSHVDQMVMF